MLAVTATAVAAISICALQAQGRSVIWVSEFVPSSQAPSDD